MLLLCFFLFFFCNDTATTDIYTGEATLSLHDALPIFTVLFAVARTVGWIAQWKEMMNDPKQKIGRPRQLYTGPAERTYVPVANRK